MIVFKPEAIDYNSCFVNEKQLKLANDEAVFF